MFVFLNKKITAGIFSTLFVTSKSYAGTAPLFIDEEKIRYLDSSCSCSITDLIGSDFNCIIEGIEDYYYDIPNFGEEESACAVSVLPRFDAAGYSLGTFPFVSISPTSAVYTADNGVSLTFGLEPTVQAANGYCDRNILSDIIEFGCWACPTPSPTNQPSDIPTDSPSDQPLGNNDSINIPDNNENDDNVNPTDNDENDGSDDEECCSLFSLLKNNISH